MPHTLTRRNFLKLSGLTAGVLAVLIALSFVFKNFWCRYLCPYGALVGIVSMFSSSSGVVLPTFMPLIPGLIAQLGGGNIWKLIIAVDIGSHMVDVSPLSTLGALCLAALPPAVNKPAVFRGLLTWGFAMAIVAAVLAFVFLDLIPW